MLMLTRRRGEAVDIVDRASDRVIATVKVCEFLPNGVVRLGFDADHNIKFKRDDIKKDRAQHGNQSEEDSGEDHDGQG